MCSRRLRGVSGSAPEQSKKTEVEVSRTRQTVRKSSQNRGQIRPKSTKNHRKIDSKSLLAAFACFGAFQGHTGTRPRRAGERQEGPGRLPGALLGVLEAAGTPPWSVRGAPRECPRRSQDASGHETHAFSARTSFRSAFATIFDRFSCLAQTPGYAVRISFSVV